jgi:hypothetical protein
MGKTHDGRTANAGYLEPSTYADGTPIDDIHYLECKLILRPDRFTSVQAFRDLGKLARRAADDVGVGYSGAAAKQTRPRIREVVFLDTRTFALYNHALILRRRIPYEDGFPIGEPEIVFKFRHPDLQAAAALDIRPRIRGDYRIKFKAEVLPLRERMGGYRALYSHNVEFGLSAARGLDQASLAALVGLFPTLPSLGRTSGKKIELVNHTIVEEVLQDLGDLDFGKGITANLNASLWRQRGDHTSLVGEVSFESKFKRRDVHEKALARVKGFFLSLQHAARDWLSLGTTKTGMVYRLRGTPPMAHE